MKKMKKGVDIFATALYNTNCVTRKADTTCYRGVAQLG